MNSNDLDFVNVIINGIESYAINEDICKIVSFDESSFIISVLLTSSNVPVIILGLVCILGAGGIYLYTNKKSKK